MIDHLSTYTTNFPAAQKFYDAVLGALGYRRTMDMVAEWDPSHPTARISAYGPGDQAVLWLMEKKEGRPMGHVAFAAKTRADVEAFYKTALANGGKDNGAPGKRAHYHPGYFGAFVLDPDGNNLEAVIHNDK